MRKLAIFTILMMALILACTKGAAVGDEKMEMKLIESVKKSMAARGIAANVEAEELQKMKNPAGFSFFRVVVSDSANPNMRPQEQYYFYNGTYLTQTFINLEAGTDLAQDLLFELNSTVVDVSNLSLIYGKAGAKNTIVKITDFECPYCRLANKHIEQAVAGKDVAVYIVHLPLPIHPNAVASAKVFEAGLLMDRNFSHELFTNDSLLGIPEDKLLDYFAEKSGDPVKFRELVNSAQVEAKLTQSKDLYTKLGITSTPVIIINNKRVDGFNQSLIDRAIADFK